MITRIDKNGYAYQCKTERRRGDLTQRVLEVAKRGKPFTRHDVLDGSDRVYNRLHNMAKSGVLKVVRKGINGRHGQATIFHINKQTKTKQ